MKRCFITLFFVVLWHLSFAQPQTFYEIIQNKDIVIDSIDSKFVDFIKKYNPIQNFIDTTNMIDYAKFKFSNDSIVVAYIDTRPQHEYNRNYVYLYDKKKNEIHIFLTFPYSIEHEGYNSFKNLCFSYVYDLEGYIKQNLYVHTQDNGTRDGTFGYFYTIFHNLKISKEILYRFSVFYEINFFDFKIFKKLADFTPKEYFNMLKILSKNVYVGYQDIDYKHRYNLKNRK
jgi:hypothetical protein